MKKILHFTLVFFCMGFLWPVLAQETARFDEQFVDIDKELNSWDPVRGRWLGNSLKAMSAGQPIPDRTFPEDFSPGEMMRLVPPSTLANIRVMTQANGQNSMDIQERERWNRMNNYLYRPDCKLVMGRSYGDPHLKSFDGEAYSFQTVGEFVLTSANNGLLEVQVRQEPQRDDFSLNTAVAMRVGGDRVGIYTDNGRANSFRSPVLVNGFPVEISDRTYYLNHGGTIRKSGRDYTVTWPTGETVTVDIRSTGRMSFMNVAVQIYPCANANYSGLLGNANGSRRDDFNVMGSSFGIFGGQSSGQLEKERQAYLAKEFANYFRVTPMSSLFDYELGQNTMTFTDYSYPRVHRSINDLPNDRRTAAQNACVRAGLTGDELNACIFDQGYLDIPPTPRPVIQDRTTNARLKPVERETPNVNPPRDIRTNPSGESGREVPVPRPITVGGESGREIINEEKPQTASPNTRPNWQSSEGREESVEPVSPVRPNVDKPTGQNKKELPNETPAPNRPARTEPKVEEETPRATPIFTPKPKPVERPQPPAQQPKKRETPAPRPAQERPKPKPSPKPSQQPVQKTKTSTPAPAPSPSRVGRGG